MIELGTEILKCLKEFIKAVYNMVVFWFKQSKTN